MAKLIISRDSGYADRIRAYVVIIDGKKIGELRNGETREFSVDSGARKISMKIDWGGSEILDFTATDIEPSFFHVSSNLRGLRLLLSFWYAFIAPNSWLRIKQASNASFKRAA